MRGRRGLTQQGEVFACALAEGLNNSEAYRRAYPASKKWKPESVWNKAAKLAKDARVRARVADLQGQIAEATVLNAGQDPWPGRAGRRRGTAGGSSSRPMEQGDDRQHSSARW